MTNAPQVEPREKPSGGLWKVLVGWLVGYVVMTPLPALVTPGGTLARAIGLVLVVVVPVLCFLMTEHLASARQKRRFRPSA